MTVGSVFKYEDVSFRMASKLDRIGRTLCTNDDSGTLMAELTYERQKLFRKTAESLVHPEILLMMNVSL